MDRLARGGPVLGLLLACRRDWRAAILGGAALGAALFSVASGDPRPLDAVGYAAIEVLAALAGLAAFGSLAPVPTRLERPRELAALVVGVLGFRSWVLRSRPRKPRCRHRRARAHVPRLDDRQPVGAIVTAPLVIAWSGFRVKRSGGLAMTEFVAGAIAAALFFATLRFLFGAGASRNSAA